MRTHKAWPGASSPSKSLAGTSAAGPSSPARRCRALTLTGRISWQANPSILKTYCRECGKGRQGFINTISAPLDLKPGRAVVRVFNSFERKLRGTNAEDVRLAPNAMDSLASARYVVLPAINVLSEFQPRPLVSERRGDSNMRVRGRVRSGRRGRL